MTTIMGAVLLKERIPNYKYIGILIVILGIVILTGLEPNLTGYVRRAIYGFNRKEKR